MKTTEATLAILTLTATLHAETISIGIGPLGSVGGYEIRSTDGWAQDIASTYAPSSRTPLGFLSFCLEKQEEFTFGTQYQFRLSPAAVRGGTFTTDPIAVGTGYLYSLFATGNLPGYAADAASTAALQNTIWWLEGEQLYAPGPFDGLLTANFITLSAAAGDSYNGNTAASYGVSAINVGTPPLYPGQDQLAYQVPEAGGLELAATVAVLMLGIILVRVKGTK